MTSLVARRVVACLASAAAAVAIVPATASATTKPDLGTQCSGSDIVGRGSTFQGPAQINVWNKGFNTNIESVACSGTQGSKGTPKVVYKDSETKDKGSGACLKGFGAEKHAVEGEISFCGTDEAPNATQKKEIEEHLVGGEEKNLETIPVLQGAVAIIVHLPEGCKASSEIVEKETTHKKLGRLVFDDTTLEGIYAGTINTWKQAIEAQKGDGSDALTCTVKSEEEDEINRVVRTDHSGTTHIFKTFLEQVDTKPLLMEAYAEEYFGNKTGCGKTFLAEEKTWAEVAEACPNQRWPQAAKVLRNTESGNSGVVNLVNGTPSSIGYADLAVAREFGFFSGENSKHEKFAGGENKKGSATKVGEQNTRFWAEIQNGTSPVSGLPTYSDPGSKADTAALASSNCKNTKYIESGEKEFPPSSTRELWNEAKAALKEEKYAICGLTYDLAFRQYAAFLEPLGVSEEEGRKRATTVENYLLYEVNGKGGGKEIKNHDYEALPKEVLKKAETGIKEIGYKIG